MKNYNETISLSFNRRGIMTLDPVMGCKSGTDTDKKGCFGDCYAARTARRYGYDFSNVVKRKFVNKTHLYDTINKINKSPFPFIRMGNTGDPSEDWEHTVSVCEQINSYRQLSLFSNEKPIVIITKHWTHITKSQIERISKYDICINTSISPLDNNLKEQIEQYERLKPYCKSVLRCVTFDFNRDNHEGKMYGEIQDGIIKKYNILETVFRCSPKNDLVLRGVIKIKETKFLGKRCNVSKRKAKIYFGKCNSCIEKCGVNM